MATIAPAASTTLNIVTSVGALVDICVNNNFQDITISIPLIKFEHCFCATGTSLRSALENNFLDGDIADIFMKIMAVADSEMQYKLIMG